MIKNILVALGALALVATPAVAAETPKTKTDAGKKGTETAKTKTDKGVKGAGEVAKPKTDKGTKGAGEAAKPKTDGGKPKAE